MMTRFAAEELIFMPESIRENSFTERHNNSIPQNNITVAEPPKCLGPPTPVIVPKTSDGDAGDPPTLEVR